MIVLIKPFYRELPESSPKLEETQEKICNCSYCSSIPSKENDSRANFTLVTQRKVVSLSLYRTGLFFINSNSGKLIGG